MSAFGGDRWAPDAQQRKRRVDDLMLSNSPSNSFKKLSNGKFACLICTHKPILDTPIAISMHSKGYRHIAAESRLKEQELSRQEELNKRIALSNDSATDSNSTTSIEQLKSAKIFGKPLIERTRKAMLETQCLLNQGARLGSSSSSKRNIRVSSPIFPSSDNKLEQPSDNRRLNELPKSSEKMHVEVTASAAKVLTDWNEELHKRREKELKFSAAGWKRDGFGKWYRDENVEFDSDEEDPNDCFS